MATDSAKKAKGKPAPKAAASKVVGHNAPPLHFSTKPVNHGLKIRQKVI